MSIDCRAVCGIVRGDYAALLRNKFDAGQVMILTQFDFLRRAVEALAVGASLVLQAANLASALNCIREAMRQCKNLLA